MNLLDDLLICCYLIGTEIFEPLDPIFPHFDDLFFLKLSCNAESGDGLNVGVKLLFFCDIFVFVSEDFNDLFLIGFDLSELRVGDEKGVGVWSLFHCCNFN